MSLVKASVGFLMMLDLEWIREGGSKQANRATTAIFNFCPAHLIYTWPSLPQEWDRAASVLLSRPWTPRGWRHWLVSVRATTLDAFTSLLFFKKKKYVWPVYLLFQVFQGSVEYFSFHACHVTESFCGVLLCCTACECKLNYIWMCGACSKRERDRERE